MGYVIKVGEVIPRIDENNVLNWEIESFVHEDCPIFFGDNSKANTRYPSYSVWGDFCEVMRLEDMFYLRAYDRTPKKAKGVIYLTEADLEMVSNSLAEYRSKVKIPPGFEGEDYEPTYTTNYDPKYDGHLARLIWLEWWMRWAIANCKMPALSIF